MRAQSVRDLRNEPCTPEAVEPLVCSHSATLAALVSRHQIISNEVAWATLIPSHLHSFPMVYDLQVQWIHKWMLSHGMRVIETFATLTGCINVRYWVERNQYLTPKYVEQWLFLFFRGFWFSTTETLCQLLQWLFLVVVLRFCFLQIKSFVNMQSLSMCCSMPILMKFWLCKCSSSQVEFINNVLFGNSSAWMETFGI